MEDHTLTLGFSPCPNDTFIFDALVHGKIDTEGLRFEPVLEDVEALNQRALRRELDVTKLSFNAFGHVTAAYRLLNAGSALGRGVGPLLVRAGGKGDVPEGFVPATVAIPGHYTTANYLLDLLYPTLLDKTEVLFSEIEDAVLAGTYEAGLLIHENRFTYAERGLQKIADLGEVWEERTQLPIPLGGIAVSRSLPPDVQARMDRVMRRSVQFALDHPAESQAYVRRYAQAMDPAVMRAHIELYVNDFTVDLGEEGRAAVRHFLNDGRVKGVIPPGLDDYIL
ncbi:menaquinone biosynthesis family protein [Neolewinella litorea]|uniref:1,4-dihydroxy-6-naphtoate synthase n=1 Tax=Neolewinella litorea TaxID=2562452 RepID=A0A4S4NNH2_9BACT|nr:1,4-dihydroxy-6-naphthoate synthase [Neolewinella litorea]THH41402.1 1,4-dihydroxy-6-naphthoate synthase [Neolewinella litorea]